MDKTHLLRTGALASILLMGASGAVWGSPCDPTSYGAVNDGVTNNTTAIQKAINRCAAAGGGTVTLAGGGTYMTGPIELRSQVMLQIVAPTILKNIPDHARYQPAFIGYPFRFNNNPAVTGVGPTMTGLPEAMISAVNVTNSGIIGDGTIDGSGADPALAATPDNPTAVSWWALAAAASAALKANPSYTYPGFPDIPTSNGLPRPWLVEFYNSANITVTGVTLTNSPMWNLGLRYDTNVTVDGLHVFNNANHSTGAPNTDGIDLVGSSGATLTNLTINTGDDNVAMKSGLPGIDPANPGFPTFAYYKPPYNLPALPLTNVQISNSTFYRGHGMSIGSETVNGVNNINAHDITFLGTDNGFRIKTGRDRGNQIYGITINNLTMMDVATPISISDYYPNVPAFNTTDSAYQVQFAQPVVAATSPHVHDILISNVTSTNPLNPAYFPTTRYTGNPQIIGIPETPMYNISLSNISITTANPSSGIYFRLRNINQLTCSNVTLSPLNSKAPAFGHVFDNESGLTAINGCDHN